jgi:hypothetical protein
MIFENDVISGLTANFFKKLLFAIPFNCSNIVLLT